MRSCYWKYKSINMVGMKTEEWKCEVFLTKKDNLVFIPTLCAKIPIQALISLFYTSSLVFVLPKNYFFFEKRTICNVIVVILYSLTLNYNCAGKVSFFQ